MPQNKSVTLNEEVICSDWHRKKCIEAFYAYESEYVSVHATAETRLESSSVLSAVSTHTEA